MSRHLWGKFWWDDYDNDPAVAVCSYASQGVWIRMLCKMAHSERTGYLMFGGRKPSVEDLAVLFRLSPEAMKASLDELESKGVFSRTQGGVIYSRRMVREQQREERDRKNGRKGGNPALKKSATQHRDDGEFVERSTGVHEEFSKSSCGVLPEMGQSGDSEPFDNPTYFLDGLTHELMLEADIQKQNTESETDKDKSDSSLALAPPGSYEDGQPSLLPAAKVHRIDPHNLQAAADAWNAMATRLGLSRMIKFDEDRRKALRLRLAECSGLDGWIEVLKTIENTPFLLGENDRNWRIDFDFLMFPKKFRKVMEQTYGARRADASIASRGRIPAGKTL